MLICCRCSGWRLRRHPYLQCTAQHPRPAPGRISVPFARWQRSRDEVDTAATTAAREAEVAKELAEYRATKRSHSAEEMAQMRAAFGPGATVVDILSGEKITL